MIKNNLTRIVLLIPCFNEELVFSDSLEKLLIEIKHLNTIQYKNQLIDVRILFIDDGSSDSTWQLIEYASITYPKIVSGVSLAVNAGHQGALMAGMNYLANNKCDAVISLDIDLQDDIKVIKDMIYKFINGADIVLGIRKSRSNDSFFKKKSAEFFYKIMRKMGVEIIYNHADFRLLSLKALKNIVMFSEKNLFLRGLILKAHKNIAYVAYDRKPRVLGISQYNFFKMSSLALDGLTSFSVLPLRFITLIGIGIFLLSILMIIYAVYGLMNNQTVQGWLSIVIPLYFLGGLLMLSIGIVGEYLGKVYFEVKRRPIYLQDKVINNLEIIKNEK